MGAFGELLIQSWGGNLSKYRGDSYIEKDNSSEEDNTPIRNEYREPEIITRIKDKIIYGYLDANKITKEFILEIKLTQRDWRRFQLWCHKYNKL